jgi:DNA mismatch repair ATPase MutS
MYIFFNATGIEMNITEYLKSIAVGYYYMASLILSVFIGNETIVDWLSKGLSFLYLAYNIYSMYQTITLCINHYTKCNNFKKDFNTMIKIVNTCKNIWNLDMHKEKILSESALEMTSQSFKKIEKIFDENKSLGYMIVTKLSCDEYYHHLTNIFDYIGTVDMVISNSKLLRNGYTSPCIDMTYDKPYIVAEQIWNPLLDYSGQIKNDCNVGLNNYQNMIITGPNKAGKSTYVRSLILSIYLAQTLGVTCAQKLYFTPFSEIFTYLNVPDAIGKESLFEAELDRCYKYYNKVITSNANNKVIGFIDELFTGTNYYEGMAGSYAITKKITESPYAITVLTTHFHEICTIPNISYTKFYATISVADSNKSKYKFSYKMEKGISDQCIALDLLQERGYGNELVEIAKTKLNEVLNKKKSKITL